MSASHARQRQQVGLSDARGLRGKLTGWENRRMAPNGAHRTEFVLFLLAPEIALAEGAWEMRTLLVKLAKDEQGSELIEYSLLLGLIVIGCLGVMSALGVKVMDRWTQLADKL
jgi:Flp pilus assembly pilin Flp